MTVDADVTASRLVDAWERLLSSSPGWWARRVGGAVGGVTTVPISTLNGVWVSDLEFGVDPVDALLDRVAATGLPHCLQVRPGLADPLSELAADRGMTPDESIPLMVLDGSGGYPDDVPSELAIRLLSPEEAQQHASLAAAGFGVPEEYFRQLIGPALLRTRGVRCYVGEVRGEPVTTGLGFTLADSVGIFNIATPDRYRRRGYGAAVTMHAVRDGFASGAAWAFLQASSLGLPVYEKLGFRAVESWRCWLREARTRPRRRTRLTARRARA